MRFAFLRGLPWLMAGALPWTAQAHSFPDTHPPVAHAAPAPATHPISPVAHAPMTSGAYRTFAPHPTPVFRPEDRAAFARPMPVWSGPRHVFVVHDYNRFNAYDRGLWNGGAWRYGWHGDRYGWWWFVGGGWYWYDAPVYPYPVVVSPVYCDGMVAPVMEAPPEPANLPVVVAPPVVTHWAPTPTFRYYCPDLNDYYPQVPNCPSGFVRQAQ